MTFGLVTAMKRMASALVVALVCAGLYALGGFLAGPYLVESGLRQYVSRIPNEYLTVGNVRVDPFRLAVQLTGLSLRDGLGSPIFSVDAADLNFGITGLARRAIALDDVSLSRPMLSVEAPASARGVGALMEAMPRSLVPLTRARIVVSALTIQDGALEILDPALDDARMAVIDQISLSASDISTDPATVERYVLDVGDAEGAQLRLDGQRLAERRTLSGRFEISSFDLRQAAPWLNDSIVLDGTVLAHGNYELSMSPPRSLRLIATQMSLREAGLRLGERAASTGGLDTGAGLEASFAASADLSGTWREGTFTMSGNAALDNLDIRAPAADRPLFAAARLLLADIDVQPSTVSIRGARTEQPYARIDAADAERRRSLQLLAPVLGGSDYALENVEIVDGRIDVVDSSVSPPLELSARRLRGRIDAAVSNRALSATTIELEGLVGESGSGTMTGRFSNSGQDFDQELELRLNGVDAQMLSPYFVRFAARRPLSGRLGVEVQYEIDASHLQGFTGIVFEDLSLEPVGTQGPALPIDLAIALTEDPTGRIAVRFPVNGEAAAGKLSAVFGDAFRDFVLELTDSPLNTLSEVVARPRPLDAVSFVPGTTEMSADSEATLAALSEALGRRPALRLAVAGTYDADADRAALAEEQVRLHVRLATAGTATLSETRALEFSNPRTKDVLDEFAATRLDSSTLAQISARFPAISGDNGELLHGEDYYEAVFDALVDNEAVSETALRSLARFRARSIIDELRGRGVASERTGTENEDVHIVSQREGMIPTLLRLQAMSRPDTG